MQAKPTTAPAGCVANAVFRTFLPFLPFDLVGFALYLCGFQHLGFFPELPKKAICNTSVLNDAIRDCGTIVRFDRRLA
jgi:hypothetical protein